jgi:hypothetical protein
MNQHLQRAERSIAGRNRLLWRTVVLMLCLSVNGCEATKVLTPAIVNACGTSTTYLSDWWARVPDNNVVQFDPMGGYQFVYWIDDANNVCHGNPGTNGQTGVAAIRAFNANADDLANHGSTVTPQQLKTFQEIPVLLDKYAGSGLHFVQIYNNLVRDRKDGKAMKFPSGILSIPNVIEVGQKSCIFPINLRVADTLPLPPFSGDHHSTQSPDKCKVRVMPRETPMSEEDRKKYDAGNFSHGNEIFSVPE